MDESTSDVFPNIRTHRIESMLSSLNNDGSADDISLEIARSMDEFRQGVARQKAYEGLFSGVNPESLRSLVQPLVDEIGKQYPGVDFFIKGTLEKVFDWEKVEVNTRIQPGESFGAVSHTGPRPGLPQERYGLFVSDKHFAIELDRLSTSLDVPPEELVELAQVCAFFHEFGHIVDRYVESRVGLKVSEITDSEIDFDKTQNQIVEMYRQFLPVQVFQLLQSVFRGSEQQMMGDSLSAVIAESFAESFLLLGMQAYLRRSGDPEDEVEEAVGAYQQEKNSTFVSMIRAVSNGRRKGMSYSQPWKGKTYRNIIKPIAKMLQNEHGDDAKDYLQGYGLGPKLVGYSMSIRPDDFTRFFTKAREFVA